MYLEGFSLQATYRKMLLTRKILRKSLSANRMGPPKLGFNSEGCVKENLEENWKQGCLLALGIADIKVGVIIEYPVYAGRAPLELNNP